MAWTTEMMQEADAAWKEHEAAIKEWRRLNERGDYAAADEQKRVADAAFSKWEATCKAAGAL